MIPKQKIQTHNYGNISKVVSVLPNTQLETDKYIERLEDGHVKCTVCGKVSTDKRKDIRLTNMKYHIETHIEGLSYPCTICDKTFRSKHSYSSHKSKFHN